MWLSRFCLDWKTMGTTATARTTTAVASKDESKWTKVWVTEAQLAGPYYLNSVSDAARSIAFKESRPHSTDKGLHDSGVLEYEHWYLKEEFKRQKRTNLTHPRGWC